MRLGESEVSYVVYRRIVLFPHVFTIQHLVASTRVLYYRRVVPLMHLLVYVLPADVGRRSVTDVYGTVYI